MHAALAPDSPPHHVGDTSKSLGRPGVVKTLRLCGRQPGEAFRRHKRVACFRMGLPDMPSFAALP